MRILSFIRDENDADEKLARIGEWFAKGGTKEATVYSRWASLLKACPADSRIRSMVESYRKRTKKNSGNQSAAGWTKAQHRDCNDMEVILGELYESQTAFWIRAKGKEPLPVPDSIANDFVLVNHSFEGVRNALKRGKKHSGSGKRILKWNPDWRDKKAATDGGTYVEGYVKAVVDDKI